MDAPSRIIHSKPMTSADQYLYHYTRGDTALDCILATGTLRMAPFTAVNDPWEAKHWVVEALFNETEEDGQAGLDFMLRTASPALKGACKLLCFTRDAPEAAAPAPPGVYDPGTVWHRGFCRPRMWAQYASAIGKSDGVCLVFEATLLEAAITAALPPAAIFKKDEIKYENRTTDPRPELTFYFDQIRSLGLDTAIAEHVARHWQALFFRKAVDWRDEREFRYLVLNVPTTDFFFPFKDALKAVVVGPDFPPYRAAQLIETCTRSFGFKPSQLNWRNGYPRPYLEMSPSKGDVGLAATRAMMRSISARISSWLKKRT